MADRYFAETPVDGEQILLTGAEAHHLAHVMRARPGMLTIVFDGSGAEFVAEVEAVGRHETRLRVRERRQVDRERRRPITIAAALPKGDRQKWLIEKLVELGVARFVPLATARAVVEPGAAAAARLRRATVEASKQCGRNRLMEIGDALSLASLLSAAETGRQPDGAPHTATPRSANPGAELRLLAHPGGIPIEQALRDHTADVGDSWDRSAWPALAVVGPEGGFDEGEVQAAAAAGWKIVGLGPTILRVETAAIAVATMLALSD